MEELKKRVAECQSRVFIGDTVQLKFYTSSVGQHYAILVTKGIWYKVRLFVEEEYPNCPSVPFILCSLNGDRNKGEQLDLSESEHLTWNGVQERINNFHKFFKKPDFKAAHKMMGQSGYSDPYFIRLVPSDYASNPDRYLKRSRRREAAGVARIGRLLGDFTTKGTENISIVFLPFRIRSGEEIAKKAEELAANKFRDGDYNILLRNCQHFVFLCATGVEFAINV